MVELRKDKASLVVALVCLLIISAVQPSFGQSDDRASTVVEQPMDVDFVTATADLVETSIAS